MSLVILLAIAVVAFIGAVLVLRAASTYRRFRGTRVITCPETKKPAAVGVDAAHAAMTAAAGQTELRLSTCTRWPERESCGQECLKQIEAAPVECLARTMLTRFYEGKSCIVCGKHLGEIHWHDHKPGLVTPDYKVVEWSDVSPERLPDVLSTHSPVCWDCVIALTFRTQHPELVVDRSARVAPGTSLVSGRR
jgi:hypothetical protein